MSDILLLNHLNEFLTEITPLYLILLSSSYTIA